MAQAGSGKPPFISAADAPGGTETFAVQWVKIEIPDLGVMLAAVARPSGVGPFSAVVLLHGTHGFARQYVQLAQDLARGDLLAIAASWFSGGRGAGLRFITPILCPESLPMVEGMSLAAAQRVDALMQAARALPDARPDLVGLFGHSRGGAAALNYILTVGNVQAAVLEAAAYPHELVARASEVATPILILHGTADRPADGGSWMTDIQMARDFEAALRCAEKPVEAVYYEGGEHNSIFSHVTQHNDEVQRMLAFFQRHLR